MRCFFQPLLALVFVFPSAGNARAQGVDFSGEVSDEDVEFFEKKIRPVLSQNCFECHGDEKQKGGLRSDSRAALLAGGDLGAAIVPGDPVASLLIKAVRYEEEDLEMPPKKKLPEAQIADLAEWIRRGAPWPGEKPGATVAGKDGEFPEEMRRHWAFQPIKRQAVPANGAANPIDAFLDQKIGAAGLDKTPRAGASVFLRRLSFDLTGLPPSPEETEVFVNEAAGSWTNAVTRAVARLLESPRYGEKFGRHWLDIARYADSNGSEVDHAMSNAWRYRDYVIRAFNEDRPFDVFLKEQIAGDLMPSDDANVFADRITATGFLMLGPKALAELDKPKLVADVVDEQVDTLSRAFMGMTVGCARCHDHKFDPISAADYYSLAGIFTSVRTIDVSKRVATWNEKPIPSDQSHLDRLAGSLAELLKQRDEAGKGAGRKIAEMKGGDPFLLVEAEDFTRGNVRVETDSLGRGIGVVRTLMEYPDHIEYEIDLPEAGDYRLEIRYAALEARPTELSINGNLVEMSAADRTTGDWKPSGQRWFVQGVYAFKSGRNVVEFRRDGAVPLFDKILIGKLSGGPYGSRIPDRPADMREETPARKQLDERITRARRELEAIPTAMAPAEGPVADAPILIRGNPGTKGKVVPRGFLSLIDLPDTVKPGPAQSGRVELADWLTDARHPLTSRVIVNRVWQWHFGSGLVRSSDNFGLRGDAPSHPELLDFLALWFMENGWSVKKLSALICASDAYQRSGSAGSPPQEDPENMLLSHFPRRRLSAEELRDGLLALSGELDVKAGGTLMTVMNRNYAAGGNSPPDVMKEMHYDEPRRSVYLPVIRSALYDLFAVFDFPDPGMLTGQRASTTVAPQALFLMNSPFMEARAAAFAKHLKIRGGDDAAMIGSAYRSLFGRDASASEIEAAISFLDADETAGSPVSRDISWQRLCQAMFASNEFLYLR